MRESARRVIGVDIGGTTTKVALVGKDGAVESLRSFPTAETSYSDNLCETVDALLRETVVDGLGVAVAGFLNPARDKLAYNPNLPWLVGYPLRESLQRRHALPVTLEVDSNAAALAEWGFGSGKESDRFLCLTAGTGLGGGMVIHGEILRFAYECVGDVGHVIVEPGGAPCSCGGKGCAEALMGADAVVRKFRASGGDATELRHVIEQARAGDGRAVRVIEETGRWLGLALSTLANIFFPDRIAVAGGLSEAGDLLLGAAECAFQENASPFAHDRARLVKAELGWKATLVGAGIGAFPRE